MHKISAKNVNFFFGLLHYIVRSSNFDNYTNHPTPFIRVEDRSIECCLWGDGYTQRCFLGNMPVPMSLSTQYYHNDMKITLDTFLLCNRWALNALEFARSTQSLFKSRSIWNTIYAWNLPRICFAACKTQCSNPIKTGHENGLPEELSFALPSKIYNIANKHYSACANHIYLW